MINRRTSGRTTAVESNYVMTDADVLACNHVWGKRGSSAGLTKRKVIGVFRGENSTVVVCQEVTEF